MSTFNKSIGRVALVVGLIFALSAALAGPVFAGDGNGNGNTGNWNGWGNFNV